MQAVSLLVLIGLAAVLVVLLLAVRSLGSAVTARIDSLERSQERIDRSLRDETSRLRDSMGADGRALREEVVQSITSVSALVQQQLESVRGTVDSRLKSIQDDNAAKLEQMRATVDEKLQGTLEKRLGESFRLVSERLEKVHQGLGEMQALAVGVGDLKKVLTNVKTRGTWGEIQLGALLEQMLSPDQFERNVPVTGGPERVEYAVRLPGSEPGDAPVWLPIDAKFPQEDYQRLVAASEACDAEAVEAAAKQFETRLRFCAREIAAKYVAPPKTTDFAILFLPTEGLYAEALRRPGLAEALQRDSRVMLAGPTTLGALLNSLQMGFRTLAIQRRSSEVWEVLGAVQSEFAKYAGVLARVQKKLQEASNTVDDAARRTRVLEKKLRQVETAGEPGAAGLLDGLEDDEFATPLGSIAIR
jgi:DNA recombination protein RmuC